MNLTEAINLAKQGRSVGWGIIIKATYNRKKFITSKYLASSLDKVLNDSYVKALSSINLLHNPGVFSSWLGIIIASISATGLRNAGKEFFSESMPYENETLYMDIVNESRNPVPEKSDFTQGEINELSKRLLKSLNVEQRMCFLYHYIEGFSVKEIARALRSSEKDVIASLNAGVKRINEICEELKKSYPKLSVFSNSLQLFTFVFETEYSYTQNTEVPTDILNKIIEDTAAIVAEKEIVEEKEAEEEPEDDDEEEERSHGFISGNKKMIVLIIIIVAIAAGLTIHFVNKGKSPSEPVNNTDKPSESETVSDITPSMDLTSESSTEENSESTSGETSSSSVPVTNQRPNTSQQPSQNQRPQNNNTTSNSGNSQTSRPQTSSTKPATNPTTKPTQPSTQPSTQPTTSSPPVTVTEPSTEPTVSEPDFEIPDIE
ncbi:MAG: hypothetical protein K2I14_09255 [Eubacterium sp.]|nr:hypothetical protein [Eubacterium sp.]